jgi:hypothetical protein
VTGHSQGSVIAYETIGKLDRKHLDGVALVTCGSPLCTLYATLFPCEFPPSELAGVAQRLEGRWTNAWRRTDPIASPLDVPSVANIELFEETPGSRLSKHSDYWTNHQQLAAVQRYLETLTVRRDRPRRSRRPSS